MRKSLLLATLFSFLQTLPSAGAPLSQEEILQKIENLEKKVQELERENRELKRLLTERGGVVPLRKKTEKVKVGGRVLFRFSQSEDLKEGQKTVFGDPGNGFTVRKVRLNVKGKLNDGFSYGIQIRADRGSKVELWDAYVKYRLSNFPVSIKAGQFKIPVSMSYLKSGTKLWIPERPVAVNQIAPVWRDVGVSVTYKLPFNGTKLTAGIFNGEGWTNKDKIYNKDKNYLYTVALDTVALNSENLFWRLRVGGTFGTDSESKGYKKSYGIASLKRHLLDVETNLTLKPYRLSLEAGYLYDNPSDARDSNGKEVSIGNAKGYYLQFDWGAPVFPKLHLVGRYSYVDPNDDVDDNRDVDYTTLGFYYLLDGWQAALRSSYTWANERHGEEVDNDLFVTEFQLLF
jgi:hypothetical protein